MTMEFKLKRLIVICVFTSVLIDPSTQHGYSHTHSSSQSGAYSASSSSAFSSNGHVDQQSEDLIKDIAKDLTDILSQAGAVSGSSGFAGGYGGSGGFGGGYGGGYGGSYGSGSQKPCSKQGACSGEGKFYVTIDGVPGPNGSPSHDLVISTRPVPSESGSAGSFGGSYGYGTVGTSGIFASVAPGGSIYDSKPAYGHGHSGTDSGSKPTIVIVTTTGQTITGGKPGAAFPGPQGSIHDSKPAYPTPGLSTTPVKPAYPTFTNPTGSTTSIFEIEHHYTGPFPGPVGSIHDSKPSTPAFSTQPVTGNQLGIKPQHDRVPQCTGNDCYAQKKPSSKPDIVGPIPSNPNFNNCHPGGCKVIDSYQPPPSGIPPGFPTTDIHTIGSNGKLPGNIQKPTTNPFETPFFTTPHKPSTGGSLGGNYAGENDPGQATIGNLGCSGSSCAGKVPTVNIDLACASGNCASAIPTVPSIEHSGSGVSCSGSVCTSDGGRKDHGQGPIGNIDRKGDCTVGNCGYPENTGVGCSGRNCGFDGSGHGSGDYVNKGSKNPGTAPIGIVGACTTGNCDGFDEQKSDDSSPNNKDDSIHFVDKVKDTAYGASYGGGFGANLGGGSAYGGSGFGGSYGGYGASKGEAGSHASASAEASASSGTGAYSGSYASVSAFARAGSGHY